MPILSTAVFDNTGHPYNVSRILTPEFLFDQKAYEEYSPVYLPITYVLSYGVQFAALTSLVTHTVCWYGKDILHQTRKAFEERRDVPNFETYQPLRTENGHSSPQHHAREASRVSSHDPSQDLPLGTEDVHCRLMRRYKDAPLTWYLIVLVTTLVIATYTVEQYVLIPRNLLACTDSRPSPKLSGPLTLVWAFSGPAYHQRLLHSCWHYHGRHQSTHQSLSDLSAVVWHCFSRTASCEHDLCDLLLHQLSPGHQVLIGSQAWALHENSATDPVYCTDGGNLDI